MRTYIFGHKKPDTDSVCSAIAYAYLKNMLGIRAEARILGDLNQETKFVLDYFAIPEPKYLNDVKIQIKNMKYLKDAHINEHTSIEETFNVMQILGVTGLPLVDDNKKLQGYVNLKDICKHLIEDKTDKINTSYENLLRTLNAKKILQFDKDIKGNIVAASDKSKKFKENYELDSNAILIASDHIHILEYAIKSNVKMIILVDNFELPEDLLALAKIHQINIIKTASLINLVIQRIGLSNYISTTCLKYDPITFKTSDYRDDFIDIASKYGHTNYPILDKNNNCSGMLRLIDQNNYEKYNIILVDHNQAIQSVDGIEEANIQEIIDHHNIAPLSTTNPISFRAMPVGCTSTIIYQMFQENDIPIPKNIAGIMLSAIISDTLLFKSPTTTALDKNTALALADIAEIDYKKYGMEMFKAGTSINGMTVKEIFEQDFKTYKIEDSNLGISQVMTLNIDSIIEQQEEYLKLLNDLNTNYNYKVAVMFVTDVIKNGSYIFYNESAKEIISNAYNIKNLEQGMYLPNIVSRKKQCLPKLMNYLQKNN